MRVFFVRGVRKIHTFYRHNRLIMTEYPKNLFGIYLERGSLC